MDWSAVPVRDPFDPRDSSSHGKALVSLRPNIRRSSHMSGAQGFMPSTVQPQQSIPSIHAVSIAPLQGSGFSSSRLRDRSSDRERTEEEILLSRRTHSAGIRNKASGNHPPYVPGDRVVFTDAPSLPGVPVVYRLPEDRQANPDRLNLDRRRLNICPLLEGEEQLRLLNLQHNMIRHIQHLSALRRLIFLDLYDNMIAEISGLQSLVSLRVLMLGKNRITSIANLERLTKLDVLDLHGNRIREIENLNHLRELRVLNLAGNQIACVHNLAGLGSLAELNLRRNVITEVYDIDCLRSLQRLFLSYNNISSYEDISCLSNLSSLIELSLDCNPYANNPAYKPTLLDQIRSLKLLDMKKVLDEEHRVAAIMAKKQGEKKRDVDRQVAEKVQREHAISNAERQWRALRSRSRQSRPQPRMVDSTDLEQRRISRSSSASTGRNGSARRSVSRERSFSASRSSQRPETSSPLSHYCDVSGDVMSLYGVESLCELDKNWGVQATAAVTTIAFHFVYFDSVMESLYKIKGKFPGVVNLVFQHNNVQNLQQLNALSCLRRLDSLTIDSDGNPVTELSLWKPYVLFRLSHLGLRKINNEDMTPSDIVNAEKLFGSLSHISTSELPQSRLLSLLGDARRKQVLQAAGPQRDDQSYLADSKRHHLINAELSKSQGQSVEAVGKAGLQYWLSESSQKKSQTFQSHLEAGEKFVGRVSDDAMHVYELRQQLEEVWPEIIHNIVKSANQQMADRDKYMRQSLENLQ